MIVFSDINKLQELADGVPHHENEEIIALAETAQNGDDTALFQLFYDLLPVFCSEYKLQAGASAKTPSFCTFVSMPTLNHSEVLIFTATEALQSISEIMSAKLEKTMFQTYESPLTSLKSCSRDNKKPKLNKLRFFII